MCFSKNDIFHITRELEKRGHEVAVIYGSLPPGYFFRVIVVCKKKCLFQLGTKLLQAQRFNDPNDSCKIMVATDAIGMGLNLYVRTVLIFKIKSLDVCFLNRSIKRVVFYSLVKPQLNEQGEKEKDTVTTSQALQISGRAGR